MIKEFWNLIVREPFLYLNWELDFSQACSFCRMLMIHKNFNFSQLSDKTNHVIFLKSPKNVFFGPFFTISDRWGFFPKNRALSHTTIYGPLTCYVSEKTNKPIPRKFMGKRKDGWTEGGTDRSYFIWPYWLRSGI